MYLSAVRRTHQPQVEQWPGHNSTVIAAAEIFKISVPEITVNVNMNSSKL